MTKNEKSVLMNLIREDGVTGAVKALADALQLYANELSDLALKDKAHYAIEVADILRDINIAIEE